MIRSMTGFTSKTIEINTPEKEQAFLTLSLKSLNSRFFEGSCKLPLALQPLEISLLTLLKNSLYRGKINLTVHLSNPNIFQGGVQPSLALAKSYVDAITQLQHALPIKGEITIEQLMNLPSIFVIHDQEVSASIKNHIIQTVQELIDQLIVIEQKEGTELFHDIVKRYALLKNLIQQIQERSQEVLAQKNQVIQQKMNALDQEKRELVELYYNHSLLELEKMDINEEIVRFFAHLKSIHDILHDSSIEKGRSIDFTVQELLRETNTIAAKCADSIISSHAITIKVELEKIREQIQNVV